MGYTVYWSQSSYNKLNPQFIDDVKIACEKYQADTGDTLNVDSDVNFIKVNSRDNGCEDLVIDNTGARIQFCKTARQEYTLIVKAILLIAQKYDYVYDLSCDDSYDTSHKSWDAAKEFVKKYNLLIFN